MKEKNNSVLSTQAYTCDECDKHKLLYRCDACSNLLCSDCLYEIYDCCENDLDEHNIIIENNKTNKLPCGTKLKKHKILYYVCDFCSHSL